MDSLFELMGCESGEDGEDVLFAPSADDYPVGCTVKVQCGRLVHSHGCGRGRVNNLPAWLRASLAQMPAVVSGCVLRHIDECRSLVVWESPSTHPGVRFEVSLHRSFLSNPQAKAKLESPSSSLSQSHPSQIHHASAPSSSSSSSRLRDDPSRKRVAASENYSEDEEEEEEEEVPAIAAYSEAIREAGAGVVSESSSSSDSCCSGAAASSGSAIAHHHHPLPSNSTSANASFGAAHGITVQSQEQQ